MMNRTTTRGFLFFAFVFLAFSISARAQEQTNRPENAPRTEANEDFALNITEKTIRESNYERSTTVETADEQNRAGVAVRVGASVRASNIVITLRGVTGNVRFRASLEKITRLLQ